MGRATQGVRRVWRLPNNLPLKITVPLVVVVLMVSGASVLIIGRQVTRIHEQAEAAQVAHFGAVIEEILGREADSGHTTLSQHLGWLCATAEKTAFLTDPKGQVRFSCSSPAPGTSVEPRPVSDVAVLRDGRAYSRWVRPLSNGPACGGCHPGVGPVGYLGIDLSEAEMADEVRGQQRLNVIAGAALAVAVAVLAVLVQTLFVYRPVVRLTQTVERIRGGDLSVRIAATQDDEVGRLGRSVNEMAAGLERAREELERTHRAKLAQSEKLAALGQLFSSIAHEVKNQLAGIIGALRVLEQDVPDADPSKAVLAKILSRMEQMSHNAVSALEFARPLKGDVTAVDLVDLIDRTLFFIERQAAEQKVVLRKRYAHDLPRARVDEDLMKEVLLNIMLNGVQAMPGGGVLDVEVRVSRPHLIDVTISDQGIGIPQENLERIFSPFFSTKAQGTGLGLYIARQIVETQRGEITVDSHPGKGTSFTIRVPSEGGPVESGAHA